MRTRPEQGCDPAGSWPCSGPGSRRGFGVGSAGGVRGSARAPRCVWITGLRGRDARYRGGVMTDAAGGQAGTCAGTRVYPDRMGEPRDGGTGPGTLRIVPANEASWDDLQAILTGPAGRCQFQRQRLGDRDWWYLPVEERAAILREETHCGDPRARETIGIVAYLDDEPVGWCAVDRRSEYGRVRGSPVPWKQRPFESKDDDTVWAIPCLVVRKGLPRAPPHPRPRRSRRRTRAGTRRGGDRRISADHRRKGGHLG